MRITTEQYGLLGHLVAGLPAVLAAGWIAQWTFGGRALTTARMEQSAEAYAVYVHAVQEMQSASESFENAKRTADEKKEALERASELAQAVIGGLADKAVAAVKNPDGFLSGDHPRAQKVAAEESEAREVAEEAEAHMDEVETKLEEVRMRVGQAAGRVVLYGTAPVVEAVARATESDGGKDEIMAVVEAMREEVGIEYNGDCGIRIVLFGDPCPDD